MIFNALIIIALIPLAPARRPVPPDRRGRAAAQQPADLRSGRRAVAVPGIKLIDMILVALHLA